VSGSTVNRELNIISAVFTTAKKEWGWVESNPVSKIRRPVNNPPRNRRISPDEVTAILGQLTTETEQTVGLMFRLALQTAMRLGELCGIREQHLMGDYVHLPHTKNGMPRDVPLTPEAKEIVAELVKREPVPPYYASKLFSLAVRRTDIKDLKFHDSRHEAATWLATKLDVMDLAKVGGWRDVKILLNTYYAPSAESLAAKLR
jgi:integrase